MFGPIKWHGVHHNKRRKRKPDKTTKASPNAAQTPDTSGPVENAEICEYKESVVDLLALCR